MRGYTAHVSHELRDPAWDELVRTAPGGHYMQSGAWADFKLAFDWSVARVTVRRGTDAVAGAQVLLRRLPGLGALGWAPKAPVLGDTDPELAERVLAELRRLVQRERVRVLMLQPPGVPAGLGDVLGAWRYAPTPVTMGPEATILLPLDRDADELLAGARPHTRRNVRLAFRKGVTVREADEGDLATFYALHWATGDRQGFSPYPERHFRELWRAFRPAGGIRLFLAEYEGEPVSGLLALTFGHTVAQHAMGWSGRHAKVKPNEAAVWAAIAWSKERGYRAFDFTWIDTRAATAVASGEPLPPDLERSVASFKLGFGGTVTLLPGAHAYVAGRALGTAFRSLAPFAYRLRAIQAAHHRLRWRWLSSERAAHGVVHSPPTTG